MDDNEIDPIYCPKCGSYGEDSCCSALKCMKEHMSVSLAGCLYSEDYVKEIEFYYELGGELYDMIYQSKNAEIIDRACKIFDELWNKIYKK